MLSIKINLKHTYLTAKSKWVLIISCV